MRHNHHESTNHLSVGWLKTIEVSGHHGSCDLLNISWQRRFLAHLTHHRFIHFASSIFTLTSWPHDKPSSQKTSGMTRKTGEVTLPRSSSAYVLFRWAQWGPFERVVEVSRVMQSRCSRWSVNDLRIRLFASWGGSVMLLSLSQIQIHFDILKYAVCLTSYTVEESFSWWRRLGLPTWALLAYRSTGLRKGTLNCLEIETASPWFCHQILFGSIWRMRICCCLHHPWNCSGLS